MGDKKEGLARIVGSNNVLDDSGTLDAYSKDESFAPPMKPRLVVKAKEADEVQKIVAWANLTSTPLVPLSSGAPHFRGDTVPREGGAVVVDLSEMNRIISIDSKNRVTMVEPGVTYGQLLPELARQDLSLSIPLLPRANKSVVASLIEREPTLVPKYRWLLSDPLRVMDVVWGNGDRMTTGEGGVFPSVQAAREALFAQLNPRGPGQIDYGKLIEGAQGTMGIVTWASVRCERQPKTEKLFLVPARKLDDLFAFAYRLLRFRFGDQLLLLNGPELAYVLGQGPDRIKSLKGELPAWVLIVNVCGRDMFPREKVDFVEKDITELASQYGLRLMLSVPGASSREVLEAIVNPSREPYWKLGYKGQCQDIFFLTTLDRTAEFVRTMYSLAEAERYPTSDIGIYIQPVQQGTSCHCEFSLPFDPGNQADRSKVQALYAEASRQLAAQGAYFSRPYGIWADMAYGRDAQGTIVLKKLKAIFDPNNVMNPGKLCF